MCVCVCVRGGVCVCVECMCVCVECMCVCGVCVGCVCWGCVVSFNTPIICDLKYYLFNNLQINDLFVLHLH